MTDLAALFREAPWMALDPGLLASADPVVTMLHQDERQLYYWLTRDYATGAGACVDLGAYFGGSTACLAAGIEASGRDLDIHAYDRFKARNEKRKADLLAQGVPAFDGIDALPAVKSMLARWSGGITFHAGDIRKMRWTGEPVELLVIDAAKRAETGDHIAAEFFPHLIAGRSIVVQQDFLNPRQPWIAAQMGALSDCFEPQARVHRETVVFRCIAPVTSEALSAARVAQMPDGAYLRAIRRMLGPLKELDAHRRMRRVLAVAKQFPNLRVAWQVTHALRDADGPQSQLP